MTVSNFDWTDKTSVRWFLLLPTGHEGPYDLKTIEAKCQRGEVAQDLNIWAEGLTSPVPVFKALELAEKQFELPPLPEEEIPPLPIIEGPVASAPTSPIMSGPKTKGQSRYLWIMALVIIILTTFLTYQWIEGEKKFSINRYAKMSPELHQRIESELAFQSWDQKIFFKEYVPADLSHIWLITSSFQTCDVEVSFQSVKEKLLSMKDDQIAFNSKGKLSGHVVEFSVFEFKSGNKIIHGLYDLDLKATNCKWDGLHANVANLFNPVDKTYEAKTKVILYSKGPDEFNLVLDNLLKKKNELLLKQQGEVELFWQDLQQKLQTLMALSLQIEQHFIEFLQKGPKGFKQNLDPTVQVYAKKFGHFLTNFVAANESYFKELKVLDPSRLNSYEALVRTTTKRIGEDTMKFIEELQRQKKAPSKIDLTTYETRLKKTFSEIKTDINEKIVLISEDRSK